MRILNAGNFRIDIDNLGLLWRRKENWLKNIIKSPNGVLIISGPTGSGKSSTLYSFVKKIAKWKYQHNYFRRSSRSKN